MKQSLWLLLSKLALFNDDKSLQVIQNVIYINSDGLKTY